MYKRYTIVSAFMLLLLKCSLFCSDKIEYKYYNTKIILEYGNIQDQQFPTNQQNAIVNAANKFLQGGAGVDAAVHQAASGQRVHDSNTCPLCSYARKHLSKQWASGQVLCPVGEARITPAYGSLLQHNITNIIHAVGPAIVRGKNPTLQQEQQLVGAYKNSLQLAKENKIKAIAFPQISVGIFNYPLKDAVSIALKTTLQFIKDNLTALDEVRFIMWQSDKIGKNGYALYKKNLDAISTLDAKTNVRIITIKGLDQLNIASTNKEQSKIAAPRPNTESRWSAFTQWFLRLIRWRKTPSSTM